MDTLTPAWDKVGPKRSVSDWAEMHCPSNAPKSGHYAGGLEDRWTFPSPETLLEFSPILSIYSFGHFPLGE